MFAEKLERDIKRLNNIPPARLIVMTAKNEKNHMISTMCWLFERWERKKCKTIALQREISIT